MGDKDNKTVGPKNSLNYDSRFGFYKHRLSEFGKISSLEPKFDALEMVYKDFNDLKC